MEREILFRGKRVDNGEWVFGSYVLDPQGSYRIYWKPFEGALSNTYHFVDNKTVGQFTGQKDSQGNKVFEGDEFTSSEYPFENDGNKNYKGIIGYSNDSDFMSWYYNVEVISDRVSGAACGGNCSDLDFSKITIIGNIHDKKGESK